MVFSTLKLLQDSKLFKKKVVQDDTETSVSPGASVCMNLMLLLSILIMITMGRLGNCLVNYLGETKGKVEKALSSG